MPTVAGFPGVEVEFGQNGQILDDGTAAELGRVVQQAGTTDLFVFSHGWNNDMAEARELTAAFFAEVRTLLDANAVAGAAGRNYAVMTVLWPSKRFAEQELIPGGAASLSPVEAEYVRGQLDDMKTLFPGPAARQALDRAKALVPDLPDSPPAQEEFAGLIRGLLSADRAEPEDASDIFFALPAADILPRLSAPILPGAPTGGEGGAANIGDLSVGDGGGAAGLGDFLGGITSAARRLLNYTTYYEMKTRAGLVGAIGVNGVLRRLRQQSAGLKLHLIGHSFGGRVVTAAADGPRNLPPVGVATLTLLQAAFSHNGLAQKYDGINDGFFRAVIQEGKVAGPIVISHTQNDRACGLAYPLASRIAMQVASALGDANDPYGAMGRNGAQWTPEVTEPGPLHAVGDGYALQPGKVYNLNADAVIPGHNDICQPQVAYAMLSAVAKT